MSETTNPTPAAFPPPPAPGVTPAPPVAYAAPRIPPVKSPAVAGVLSILPGVGHVYLGLYTRAAVFFAVWVLSMSIAGHAHGPVGVIVPFWWFFVLIDAVRQAQAINACCPPGGLSVTAPAQDDFATVRAGGSLGLGVFLILIGAWFLLDRFVTIDLSFLVDWWPLLLVLFGAWQVISYFKSREKPRADEPAL
jgi:hypothetical protein